MDEYDLLPKELSLEVVYQDDFMFELEAKLETGAWRGRTRAYTTVADVQRFADGLLTFVNNGTVAVFEAGAESGIGLIGLRFYPIERGRHFACHARFAQDGLPSEPRPEAVARLAVEFPVEVMSVERFARQLLAIANNSKGRATLAITS